MQRCWYKLLTMCMYDKNNSATLLSLNNNCYDESDADITIKSTSSSVYIPWHLFQRAL